MKQDSFSVYIPSPSGDPLNPTITPVPIDGNANPIWDGFTEPTLSVLQSAYTANIDNIVIIPDPIPQPPLPPQPDWDGLLNHILGGALYSIYERLTQGSFVDPATATLPQIANANNIAVAAGKLDQSVQVTKVEGAVAASFQLLIGTSDYRFTNDERTLWNATVDDLNFTSLMYLP
jgi:hypothetical protein